MYGVDLELPRVGARTDVHALYCCVMLRLDVQNSYWEADIADVENRKEYGAATQVLGGSGRRGDAPAAAGCPCCCNIIPQASSGARLTNLAELTNMQQKPDRTSSLIVYPLVIVIVGTMSYMSFSLGFRWCTITLPHPQPLTSSWCCTALTYACSGIPLGGAILGALLGALTPGKYLDMHRLVLNCW